MLLQELFEADRLFFIADTHIGHRNIIKHCKRPFLFDSSKGFNDKSNLDVNWMNNDIVTKWNSVITDEDDVFVVGDFFYKTKNGTIKHILDSLNYRRLFLVEGNHDHRGVLGAAYLREYFTDIQDRFEIRVREPELNADYQTIVLDHYPMLSWNHMGRDAWHLYGHVHTNLPYFGKDGHPHPNAIEIGYDCKYMDREPKSYNELKELIRLRKKANAN